MISYSFLSKTGTYFHGQFESYELVLDHKSKCRVLIKMISQLLPNCFQSIEHSKFDLHEGPTEPLRNFLNQKNRISSQISKRFRRACM